MSKRGLMALLLGVNLLLLVVLLGSVVRLPEAFAQSSPKDAQFFTITAKAAGQSYDVLYMLDLGQGAPRLHAFYPSARHAQRLSYAGCRDLDVDFGKVAPR